ncbi:MAG: ghrB [Acidimicrobiaceae bacterium]|jgi:phosphoglycerate dehydrogenase-like enzyme|nr:ghrB [Acidimicrobiaceae bacterium]
MLLGAKHVLMAPRAELAASRAWCKLTSMGPRIFLSQMAYERHWTDVESVAPTARAVVAGTASWGNGRGADLAWVTFDVWSTADGGEQWFAELVRLEGLQWCHTSGAGVDAAPYRVLGERGVRLSTSHVTADAVADFALRGALDALQGAGDWREAQAERAWRRHEFTEMFDTTWLVVGLGAIGQAVSRRAKAFGARVIGCRRSPDGAEPCDLVVLPSGLAAAVPEADVVVLAAPATPDTRALVDAGFLATMKRGSILVNVARGALVDEAALIAALDLGRPAVAILDAFVEEPLPPSSPLWGHERVVITPHNAASGRRTADSAARVFLANLERWQRRAPLEGEVVLEPLEAST